MRVHALRLAPGSDLKAELERLTRERAIAAGFVLTAVGSLSRARLRMPTGPGEPDLFRTWEEPLELVSLAGTLSPDGLHLHAVLSRADGACGGGHLVVGCEVRTTAELVIGEADDLAFRRRSTRPGTGSCWWRRGRPPRRKRADRHTTATLRR
jgi:predicted DNA-binding protein with PD1-like motif